jgi:hypothetical protein
MRYCGDPGESFSDHADTAAGCLAIEALAAAIKFGQEMTRHT